MTEFIWVVGPSAIGKVTFIERVMEDQGPLRHNLGLPLGENEVVARKYGWDLRNDEFRADKLLSFPLVKQASHVLIKHQNKFGEDPKHLVNKSLLNRGKYACVIDLAEQVAEQATEGIDKHRIIVLWAKTDDYLKRHQVKRKGRSEKKMTPERYRKTWTDCLTAAGYARSVVKRKHVVSLEARNASTEAAYDIIPPDTIDWR